MSSAHHSHVCVKTNAVLEYIRMYMYVLLCPSLQCMYSFPGAVSPQHHTPVPGRRLSPSPSSTHLPPSAPPPPPPPPPLPSFPPMWVLFTHTPLQCCECGCTRRSAGPLSTVGGTSALRSQSRRTPGRTYSHHLRWLYCEAEAETLGECDRARGRSNPRRGTTCMYIIIDAHKIKFGSTHVCVGASLVNVRRCVQSSYMYVHMRAYNCYMCVRGGVWAYMCAFVCICVFMHR